jgi:hypothetical protein
MEARSVVVVDGVEELSEELSSVVLVVVGGVVALLAEDGARTAVRFRRTRSVR